MFVPELCDLQFLNYKPLSETKSDLISIRLNAFFGRNSITKICDFHFLKLFPFAHFSQYKHQNFSDYGGNLHVTQSERIFSFPLFVPEILTAVRSPISTLNQKMAQNLWFSLFQTVPIRSFFTVETPKFLRWRSNPSRHSKWKNFFISSFRSWDIKSCSEVNFEHYHKLENGRKDSKRVY